MNRLYRIKLHAMEASTKFEGKWKLLLFVDNRTTPDTFWVSHKQMTSVQRNADKPLLFAAFDTSKDKHRFIWASDNKEWLTEAFKCVPHGQGPDMSFESIKSHVEELKTKIAEPVINWDTEELPF